MPLPPLAASVLAESGDIVYPKLDPERDMIPFDQVAHDFLNDIGLGCHDCSSSDEAKSYLAAKLCNGPSSTSTPLHGYHSQTFPWPCEFFASDTSGEKTFEEFYTDTDVKDEAKFVNLGVVKNAKRPTVAEVEGIFAELHRVFDADGSTKADVVAALGKYLGNFHHIEKGKSLDSRM